MNEPNTLPGMIEIYLGLMSNDWWLFLSAIYVYESIFRYVVKIKERLNIMKVVQVRHVIQKNNLKVYTIFTVECLFNIIISIFFVWLMVMETVRKIHND